MHGPELNEKSPTPPWPTWQIGLLILFFSVGAWWVSGSWLPLVFPGLVGAVLAIKG